MGGAWTGAGGCSGDAGIHVHSIEIENRVNRARVTIHIDLDNPYKLS